jgi:hypothetical protein
MNLARLLSTAIVLHIFISTASAVSIEWLGYVRCDNSTECEFVYGVSGRNYGRLSDDELVEKYSSDNLQHNILFFVQSDITIRELDRAFIVLSRTKINSVLVMVNDGSRYPLYVDLQKSGDKYPKKFPYDINFNKNLPDALDSNNENEEIEEVIDIPSIRPQGESEPDPKNDTLLPPQVLIPPTSDGFVVPRAKQ